MSALRYIGRKRPDVAEDKLFASDLHYISNGGIVLRRRTTEDDYFRLRVPDTDCPPLPRTEPLDDGRVDTAEPNRWVIRGDVNTSNGWTFNPENRFRGNTPPEGGVPLPTDFVCTSYSCYSSGLLGPGDGRSIAAYFSTTYQVSDSWPPNTPPGDNYISYADICYLRFGGVGIGVASICNIYSGNVVYASSLRMAYLRRVGGWSFNLLN
jgi:hypothetical protein